MNTTKHCAPSFVFINLICTLGRGASQAGLALEAPNRPDWMGPPYPGGAAQPSRLDAARRHITNRFARLVRAKRPDRRPGRWRAIRQGFDPGDDHPARVGCAEPDARFNSTKEPSLDYGQTSGLERGQ